ncbi:holin [Paenibacillus sp. 1011MAR3C5]|nr:holin [Paenibacillus sp. 1011MAR3C5]
MLGGENLQLGAYINFWTTKEITFYGVVGGIGTYMFGTFTGILEVLFLAMAFDWITGVTASVIEKKTLTAINSKKNFIGGVKKFFMIMIVFLSHRIDLAFDLNWVMTGVIYFWLINEFISISENFSRMEIPFPAQLKKFIAILKDRSSYDEKKSNE